MGQCYRLSLNFFFSLAKNHKFLRPFVTCKGLQKLFVFLTFYADIGIAATRFYGIVVKFKIYNLSPGKGPGSS